MLSDAQQQAYRAELDSLRSSGVNLLYQSSPDDGLSQIGRLKPRLVIVGMNVEMMEGLEFVALLMKRYPDFDREIIVLPDKGDPFSPVAQRRDAKTGRSITEHIDLDAMTRRVRAAVQDAPAASPHGRGDDVYVDATAEPYAMSPLTATGETIADDLVAELASMQPAPSAQPPPTAGATPEIEPRGWAAAVQPAESRLHRMKWALIIAAGVLASAGVAAMVSGDSDSSGEATSTPAAAPPAARNSGSTPPAPKQRAEPPAPKPATAPEPLAPSNEPPGPTVDLSDLVTVPLSFARRQVEPGETTDPDALDTLLAAMRDALRDNPDARIEVGGHTSQEGSPQINQTLGRRRARAAGRWLSERGLPEARIVLENYASSKPVSRHDTDASRKENRRVTVRLLE